MWDERASARRLLAMLDDLVDERVGIVRFLREAPREAGAPVFFHFHAKACDTSAFSRHANFSNSAGASVSRESAMAKAVGEAIERYCAALFTIDELPLTSRDRARFPCTRRKPSRCTTSAIRESGLPVRPLRGGHPGALGARHGPSNQ